MIAEHGARGRGSTGAGRAHPLLHAPLLLLAVVFSLPFVWLLASSLQPREQIGKPDQGLLPQRWQLLAEDGSAHWVTPPVTVAQDSVLIRVDEGPQSGKSLLLPAAAWREGRVELELTVGGGRIRKDFAATRIQEVPQGWLELRSWQAAKYAPGEAIRFYAPAERVRSTADPVWQNYPEAVRALSASTDESLKRGPLLDLLAASRLPWHASGEGRTITFFTYLGNTLMVAILGTLGTVVSSALAAYGLARLRWRGRGAVFAITLATMMIPFPVLMVPLYGVFRELGWIGTTLPLWVPAWFGSAFNIFLLRQFFLTIPGELADAARVDGCGEWRVFRHIVLPLAKPALAVVALFHFLHAWNDFLGPLLFLTEPADFTLSLGLQDYQSQSGGSEWHLLMAASVLLVLPIVVLFFLTQRTFIQGIATTGGKG